MEQKEIIAKSIDQICDMILACDQTGRIIYMNETAQKQLEYPVSDTSISCLLYTSFAAIISTILWYQKENRKELRLGTLSLMYWGASIMWFVDAIFEYAELHAAYFTPDPMDMLNDLFLGLSVVAFGLIIWLVILLIQDPKKIVRNAILNQ